jgi:regulatory protein
LGPPDGSEREADAFTRGLGALRRRERTVSELHDWLAERGFEAIEIEVAIERLAELGELDDERFALRFAEDKRELSGWGPDRIRKALLGRGVDAQLVDQALAPDAPDRQVERALTLLRMRGDPLTDERERAKALSFLARRGYELELAYEAVRRHGREAGEDAGRRAA